MMNKIATEVVKTRLTYYINMQLEVTQEDTANVHGGMGWMRKHIPNKQVPGPL